MIRNNRVNQSILPAARAYLGAWLGAADAESRSEALPFKLGDEWKALSRSDKGKTYTITYIREGDDLNHWKEMIGTMSVAVGVQGQ